MVEVPARAQLSPPAPRPAQVGATFPAGWVLAELSPRLVLEQRWTDDLFRRAVVPLGPLLLGAFLVAVTREADWGVQLAVAPLGVLLLGVALLGGLNFRRALRRKRDGVRLAIEPTAVTGYPEARGWLSDYFVTLRQVPRTRVSAVTLTVYRDPKRGTVARAKLHVELAGGAALVGPEASGPDLEWPAVRDAVLPAAAEVARALGLKLTLAYPWCEQRVEVSW